VPIDAPDEDIAVETAIARELETEAIEGQAVGGADRPAERRFVRVERSPFAVETLGGVVVAVIERIQPPRTPAARASFAVTVWPE